MSGFNLPPGCNVSDLPGNTDEDVAFEKLFDDLIESGMTAAEIRAKVWPEKIRAALRLAGEM